MRSPHERYTILQNSYTSVYKKNMHISNTIVIDCIKKKIKENQKKGKKGEMVKLYINATQAISLSPRNVTNTKKYNATRGNHSRWGDQDIHTLLQKQGHVYMCEREIRNLIQFYSSGIFTSERMPYNVDDSQFSLVKKELEVALERNCFLLQENEQLKEEVARLKKQVCSLRAQNIEKKSAPWNKLHISSSVDTNSSDQKPTPIQININQGLENACSRLDSPENIVKERQQRIPKPPPKPAASTLPQQVDGRKVPPAQAPPPPPPPPPPLTSKLGGGSVNVVRRVPEVMEIYRSLTRTDTKIDSKTCNPGTLNTAITRNMIGEIENRSTYLLAIKSDVETQGEFIRFLIKEVENAAYKEISDVEAFVKWLDGELSYLVDERAVLKHFTQWPEQKADAMREAAFNYRDLKNLESEVSSFRDNPKQPLLLSLKRMQAFQDRIERSVHSTERSRESVSKRYKEFHIPWQWMLDTGVISQLKLSSMRLAKEYMRRIARELQTDEHTKNEDLMRQGVRFAFRVHQFAGGFDGEAMNAFKDLQKVIDSFQGHTKTISM